MNSRANAKLSTVRKLLWALVLTAAGAVGVALALQREGARPTTTASVDMGRPQGGRFTLVDQTGRRVTEADFPGYRLIYFGYTFCPDVCPPDVAAIAQGVRLFAARDPARARRVHALFITVDPARDTPAVLKQFVAAFDDRVVGLTGDDRAIASALATFGVAGRGSVAKLHPPGPGGGYLVDHTRFKMLYAPDGRGLAFLPENGSPQDIADALDTFVK